MHRTPRPGAPAGPAVTCYVFDCLALDGRDVRGMPLVARKALCRERIPRRDPLRYCDHVDHGGDAFLRAACAAALEGVVAKRSGSVYRAGRSREWLKVKCTREESFVIGGWTDPSGTRGHLGALHVGEWRDGALKYAGKVGSGFDQKALATLARALEPLETEVSPFTAGEPPRGRTHHWVEPQLRCRVRYVERTPDGRLRHPVFMGLDAGGTPPPRARSTTPRRPPSRR
jgi:bifunctional non-homologous end joining protein LigD